jgi:hypothetical protein
MAATLHDPTAMAGGSLSPVSDAAGLVPWSRLIAGLSAIPAITKLGVVAFGGTVDLWVLMADEDDDAEAEVSRLERDYRVAIGPAPFELHVVPLTGVDEANLPSFETIFSR